MEEKAGDIKDKTGDAINTAKQKANDGSTSEDHGCSQGRRTRWTKDTREKTAAAATEKTSLAGTGLLVFVGERLAEGSWSIQESVNAAAPGDNLWRY